MHDVNIFQEHCLRCKGKQAVVYFIFWFTFGLPFPYFHQKFGQSKSFSKHLFEAHVLNPNWETFFEKLPIYLQFYNLWRAKKIFTTLVENEIDKQIIVN